jgi:hypothetical protein
MMIELKSVLPLGGFGFLTAKSLLRVQKLNVSGLDMRLNNQKD